MLLQIQVMNYGQSIFSNRFDNGSKVDVNLEPLDRPIIPNEI
jgi:hypothetical protein